MQRGEGDFDATGREAPDGEVDSTAQPSWWGAAKAAHTEPRTPVSVVVDAEGTLHSPLRANTVWTGSVSLPVGASLSHWLGEKTASLLKERVAAALSLSAHLQGGIDAEIGGVRRRLVVSIMPDGEGEPAQCCTMILRDVTGLPVSVSGERPAWHMTQALAAGIAHRFNNLLVAITGNAGLLRMALPLDHPDQAAIEDMDQSAREMAKLTQYLLAFAGEGRYAPRPVAVHRLIERAVGAVEKRSWPDAELVCDLDPDLPPIEADPAQIEQAVFNLVLNALEALPGGKGRVVVRTTRSADEPVVVVAVVDDGAGMEEDVRARMYEPFFTTRAAGRGLGLPAVQGIARGHRGSLRVRSAPGKGTTVELRLPLAQTDSQPTVAREQASRAEVRNTVLVIDDDPGTVRVMQRTLRAKGYDVISAQDGESALRAAERGRERLLACIADMALPDTTGDVLCKQLKDLVPGVRVLVCSGYSDDGTAQQASSGGADGFLAKPFHSEELVQAVKRVLGR